MITEGEGADMSRVSFGGAEGRAVLESDGSLRVRHHFAGAVQSRGFRYACVKASGKAHVTGYVENQPDGTVVAETQGNPQQQQAFLERLSMLMKGYGTEWHDAQVAIPPIEGEGTFCVRS